jgi:hypothetical protein
MVRGHSGEWGVSPSEAIAQALLRPRVSPLALSDFWATGPGHRLSLGASIRN